MMKKNILFAATLIALMAGCSSNDQLNDMSNSKVYTLSAGFNESDSRVVYTPDNSGTVEKFAVNWETTDGLTLYTPIGSVGTFGGATVASDKHDATFTGTFSPEPNMTTDIYAYVNRSKVTMDAATVATDLSSQDGTLADAALHDILFASVSNFDPTTATSLSLNFAHKMSFLKLVLTFPTTETGTTVSNITLKGTGLYKSVALTTSTGALASSAEGSITIPSATISNNKATVYVCVYPGTVSNMTAYATVGTNAYTFNVQGTTAKTLAAQKVYTIARSNASVTSLGETATAFGAGSGDGSTADNAILITNLAELKYLADKVKTNAYTGKYFKLTNDIYLGDGTTEWTPIGNNTISFRGNFDGQNHTISGVMKMSGAPSTDDGFGLFGNVTDSEIKNINNISTINVTNSNVAKSHTGSIIGRAAGNSAIINCHNSGDISSNSANVGGIVGFLYTSSTQNLTVERCSNTGNIENNSTITDSSYTGGIIGAQQLNLKSTSTITITACYNTASSIGFPSRTSAAYAGGIIGNNNNNLGVTSANIKACWSSASTIKAGGKGLITASSKNGTYTKCYAKTIGTMKLINSTNGDVTDADTFTTLTPTSTQISAMNTAWGSTAYKFDVNGNIVTK